MNKALFQEWMQQGRRMMLGWDSGTYICQDTEVQEQGDSIEIGTDAFRLTFPKAVRVQREHGGIFRLGLPDGNSMAVASYPDSLQHFICRMNRASKIQVQFPNGMKAWIEVPHYAWVCECSGELLIASQDASLAVGQVTDAELYDSEGCWDLFRLTVFDGSTVEVKLFGNDTLGARLATGLFEMPGSFEAADSNY
ncbi:MAG: hypothetical protein Q4F41_09370 [Eubacteriales bacterium]|nr:hypothetical protein [Eubacteriales bacterium]